jgi:ferrous iron transport protein A
MTLSDIPIGSFAYVRELKHTGGMRRRLNDIGLVRGTRVACLFAAPSGDPRAYAIRSAVIAIREPDARKILVTEKI